MDIRFRKLFGLVLSLSVVFAGMGSAHAIGYGAAGYGDHGGPAHHAHVADGAGHVDHKTAGSVHRLIHCPELAGKTGKAPPFGHGEKSGCCHAVDSPTNTATEIPDWATSPFDSVRLAPHPDQTANSHITDGLLRPPRSRA